MLDPYAFLIITAAALYAALAITKTHGPYGVFERLRQRVPLGGLMLCYVCLLVWCAAVCWLLWLTPLQPLVWLLAIAGAGVFFASWSGSNHI